MILDLEHFISKRSPDWAELEALLGRFEEGVLSEHPLAELRQLHALYSRTSADLAALATFSAETGLRSHLESLVAQAYGEMNRGRNPGPRFSPWRWFTATFPRTFRRHWIAFALSCLITVVGMSFGGLALALDPSAKPVLLPFSHLQGDPSQRVAEEESPHSPFRKVTGGEKATFSTSLMTHNIQVSIFTLALGITAGFGTAISLFYNGVILGAVAVDYISDGQTAFLLGWLLPHGSIEIPSILIAGQGGLLFGQAIVGYGSAEPLSARLRRLGPDLVTLTFGLACLLVWAGLVEAFFSQYHQPVLPYPLKIAFGAVELLLLASFLTFSGRRAGEAADK